MGVEYDANRVARIRRDHTGDLVCMTALDIDCCIECGVRPVDVAYLCDLADGLSASVEWRELCWEALNQACSDRGVLHPMGNGTWEDLCDLFVGEGRLKWNKKAKLYQFTKGETS